MRRGGRIGAAILGLAVLASLCRGSPAEESGMKIVTFGTSLTARGGWQKPLEAALADCLDRPVEVAVVAKSGSTSDWALANVADVVAGRPDVVLVEFYANDAALNRFMRLSTSRETIAAVYRTLRAGLPQARILSMGMNPFHGLRGAIRPFADSYVEAHREAAAALGIGFVDFRPLWASRGDAWLAEAIPDGTHPRPEAAAAVMVPKLVAELSGGRCASARPSDAAIGDQ